MTGLEAIPGGRAIDRGRARVARGGGAIGEANARVEVERRGLHDRVVQTERGDVLALSEQRRGAALDVPEGHHAAPSMTYTCRARVPSAAEGLVKKCASCSKDLPDAALHCVFCGAKQAPAPAQAGLQKTVMGYSAQEMLAQMKAQGVPPGTPGAPQPAPALFPAQPANVANAATMYAPAPAPSASLRRN